MKKLLTGLGVIVVLLLLIGSLNGGNTPNSNIEITGQDTANASETDKEKMTISNTSFKSDQFLGRVVGEIQNNDTKTRSATLKATFYDTDGKILGTATGAVNEVAANEKKTFELITTDKVENYKEMKVQIDTLI